MKMTPSSCSCAMPMARISSSDMVPYGSPCGRRRHSRTHGHTNLCAVTGRVSCMTSCPPVTHIQTPLHCVAGCCRYRGQPCETHAPTRPHLSDVPRRVCHDDTKLAEDAPVKVAHIAVDPLRLLQCLQVARHSQAAGPRGHGLQLLLVPWVVLPVHMPAARQPQQHRCIEQGACQPCAQTPGQRQFGPRGRGLHWRLACCTLCEHSCRAPQQQASSTHLHLRTLLQLSRKLQLPRRSSVQGYSTFLQPGRHSRGAGS